MGDNGKKGWPKGYDGRFGHHFDDEVDTGSVVKVIIGTALITVAAIFIIIGILPFLTPEEAERGGFAPLAIEGPRLQADPEGELEALHREEAAHLGARVGNALPPEGSGWGWVDESAGVVHLPIDVAMDVYLESRGVNATEGDQGSADHSSSEAHGSTEDHGSEGHEPDGHGASEPAAEEVHS